MTQGKKKPLLAQRSRHEALQMMMTKLSRIRRRVNDFALEARIWAMKMRFRRTLSAHDWAKLVNLCNRRSPEQIRRMERNMGLGSEVQE